MKGKGVAAVEDVNGFHGKPLDDPEEAIEELGGLRQIRIEVAKPEAVEPHRFPTSKLELPRYELGSEIATRKAYGEALAALGSARGDIVALDGEVSNSTFAEIFAKEHPDRFFEMYIAEQQMVAAAVGSPDRRLAPLRLDLRRVPVAGVRLRAHGCRQPGAPRVLRVARRRVDRRGRPSQMGLEDIAAFRAIHGSVVLHPCDGNQTAKLVAAMADFDGISYLRTLRPATAVIYGPDEEFDIGGSRVLRSSDDDEIALIAAGITLPEALKAADALAEDGIAARVIDCYSIKPLDVETLLAAAEATQGRLVTIEDHWPEGGLGEAVLSALAKHGRAAASRQARGAGDAELGKARAAARGRRHRCGAHRRGGPHAHCRVVGASRAVGAVGAERRPRSGLRLHTRGRRPLAAAASRSSPRPRG